MLFPITTWKDPGGSRPWRQRRWRACGRGGGSGLCRGPHVRGLLNNKARSGPGIYVCVGPLRKEIGNP